jgi:uncharacterized protein with PQ loop repeat
MSYLATILGVACTLAGVVNAVAALFQALRLRALRSAREISLSWLAVSGASYLLWLGYGLVVRSTPLIVTDAVGLACLSFTLGIAWRLRHGIEDRA